MPDRILQDLGCRAGRVASGFGYEYVLGALDDDEVLALSDGDYAEVTQRVDLTDVDIVTATMTSAGVSMGTASTPARMEVESDTLLFYPMDRATYAGATNWVSTALDLVPIGDVEVGSETYSPAQGPCRTIPVGSTTGYLRGANDPQAFNPDPLTAWTVEWWQNFDCDSQVLSTSDPVVFDCLSGANGFKIYWDGVVGSHQWRPTVEFPGATICLVPAGVILANPGWHHYAFVYDGALAGVNRLVYYVDGVAVGNPLVAPPASVPAPSVGTVVQVADPDLTGDIDQLRVSNTAHAAPTVLAAYQACTGTVTTYNYRWRQQILVDSTVLAERTIAPAEARAMDDFRVPVRNADIGDGWGPVVGPHDVAFRLYLEAY